MQAFSMAFDSSTIKYYHYEPSLAASCIFAILFGVATVWQAFLIAKHRTWFFIPLVAGGIFEIVGYAARAVSNRQMPNPTLGPYVIQTLLLLVAPPLVAATIYMILGRIIVSVDAESYSLVKRRWLTKVFVTCDVISFFIQLGGAGLMASSKSKTSELGSHIVLAGLLAQIIIFGFFIAIAVVFHCRMRAMPTRQSSDPELRWELFMHILYATCTLIMIRYVVRVAEFIEGFSGYIILHEVFLYVFDGVPMAAVMVLFIIWYPVTFSIPNRKTEEDTEGGSSHNPLPYV